MKQEKFFILTPGKSSFSRSSQIIEWVTAAELKKSELFVKNYRSLGKFAAYVICGLDAIRFSMKSGNVVVLTFDAKPAGIAFLLLFFLRRFKRGIFIYDFGYPFSDIPGTATWKRITLSMMESAINNYADYIIFESEQCKSKYKLLGERCQLRVFYSLDYYLMKSRRDLDNHDNATFSERSSIKLLFRGNLNRESGILVWIDLLKPLLVRDNRLKLCISGKGYYLDRVKAITVGVENIEVITDFLPTSELMSLINSSDIMLGQAGVEYARLDTTIPHKFFEATFLDKPYLGPPSPPLTGLLGSDWETAVTGIMSGLRKDAVSVEDLAKFIDFVRERDLIEKAMKVVLCANDNLIAEMIYAR